MMDDTMSSQDWAALAASRGQVFGFLGALYCKLPDERFASGLMGGETSGFLAALAGQEQDLNEDMAEGVRLIEQYIQSSRDMPLDELLTQINVERTRLMRGVKPGYGPMPPYENVYSADNQEFDAYPIAAVLSAYAQAHAVMPEGSHDQPDYIGVELDFLRHLCEQEAKAWQASDSGAALDAVDKERAFLADHVGTWVPKYCDVMFDDARTDLYRGVARLTKGFIADENARLEAYPSRDDIVLNAAC